MDYKEAYAKSLRLLTIRFLSEGELRKKLRDRKAEDDIINRVLDTLKEEHFIDDDRLAHEVYRYYAKKEQYGHRYIVNCLKKRYLPIPEDVKHPDEYAVASVLVKRKFDIKDNDPRKIARYLQYRGFSVSVIKEILNWDV